MSIMELEGLAQDYDASFLIEPHRHNSDQIVHAIAGIMRVRTEDGIWVVPPNRALWIPRGVVHAISCVGSVRMRTVYLKGLVRPRPDTCAVWFVTPLMQQVLVRLADNSDSPIRNSLMCILMHEIKSINVAPLRLPQPRDPRLRTLCETVMEDPGSTRTLAAWACSIGMSERNLIARFQAETGFTFREWRRQARLLRSLEMLCVDVDVTQVAFAVGYASTSAFVEAFRLSFGTTPRRYFS